MQASSEWPDFVLYATLQSFHVQQCVVGQLGPITQRSRLHHWKQSAYSPRHRSWRDVLQVFTQTRTSGPSRSGWRYFLPAVFLWPLAVDRLCVAELSLSWRVCVLMLLCSDNSIAVRASTIMNAKAKRRRWTWWAISSRRWLLRLTTSPLASCWAWYFHLSLFIHRSSFCLFTA